MWYNRRSQRLARIIKRKPDSFWHYFPFLPLLRRRHIISRNEGAVPVERWSFLEAFAKEKYGLEIKVHVYRNDLNGGTGTFKDPAASMAAKRTAPRTLPVPPKAAAAREEAEGLASADTVNSFIVFQRPHEGQRPTHLGES